ncbi:phosphonopyruvate decarboxylase [Spartinivicinus poritis]|uniref:Phosphonopyruvate decarboxylase n=1 Tax=Spartinivicinus poritis TaxID=2994640 RepID=A0ABT5U7V5_9GAMM|nr:phosphonopyruvate decarboxylase [Spartinivicinus sp. A2-2]MDE1462458.1 phosphonopyruvate decarboxylase [Spartinivicinus sp. A2-2]
MVNVQHFVSALIDWKICCFTGVPCSYLTPLVNEVIARPDTRYLMAANEGEALSIASGLWLAGNKAVVLSQNSGLGNMINPLTSLNAPFRIPVLLLMTWRGQPGTQDEPQHELMGSITPSLLEKCGVSWSLLPEDPGQMESSLKMAIDTMEQQQAPHALIMTGDQFEGGVHVPSSINAPHIKTVLPARADALETLLAHADPEGVMIATTGKTGRELFTLADRPEHLYCVGSMGYTSAIAHGVALGCPSRRVYVIDGDGAALMHAGSMSSIGASAPANLVHIVLDNGCYDSTGAQPTSAQSTDFVRLALAFGYTSGHRCTSLADFARALNELDESGPCLLHLTIQPGSMKALGRPTIAPPEVARRLKRRIG